MTQVWQDHVVENRPANPPKYNRQQAGFKMKLQTIKNCRAVAECDFSTLTDSQIAAMMLILGELEMRSSLNRR